MDMINNKGTSLISKLSIEKNIDLAGLEDDIPGHATHSLNEVSEELSRDSYEFLLEIPNMNLILIKEQTNAKFLSSTSNLVISFWNSITFTKIDSIKLEECSSLIYIEKTNYLVTSNGFGTIIVYSIMKPFKLKTLQKIKANRGSLTQLVELKGTNWLASFGFDVVVSRRYSIKVWDLKNFKQIFSIETDENIEVNILYIPKMRSFAVLSEYEILIISYLTKKPLQRIPVEIYGKSIQKQLFLDNLGLLILLIEDKREDEYCRQSFMVWRFSKNRFVRLNSYVKCRHPVFLEKCCIGSISPNLIAEFPWNEERLVYEENRGVTNFPQAQYPINKLNNNLLLQIVGRRMKVWKY